MEKKFDYLTQPLEDSEIIKIEEFRKSKKIAILTILFSDIVDSTYAAETLGEQAFSRLRHIHDELFIRIMCQDNAGTIIKEIGDSFLCVFAEPSTAVLRSVEFQRAIHSNQKNLTLSEYTLKVRIGIHIGQVAVEDRLVPDIIGRQVNRAARIESIAAGGQVLTSEAVWENAVGWLTDNNEENIGWIRCGKTKLHGINEKVEVYAFYAKELNKAALPKIFRVQKIRKVTGLALFLLLSAVLAFFVKKTLNSEPPKIVAIQKNNMYVQFDFSKIANLGIDTVALTDSMLDIIIADFSSDSIITASDMKDYYANKGQFYQNRDPHLFSMQDSLLVFSDALFVNVNTGSLNDGDSLHLYLSLFQKPLATSHDYNGINLDTIFTRHDFIQVFDDVLSNSIMTVKKIPYQIIGYIENYSPGLVLFRLTGNIKLRVGSSVIFVRYYQKKQGIESLLTDTKNNIDYLRKHKSDSMIINDQINLFNFYKDIVNHIPDSSNFKSSQASLFEGKIIKLNDSVGIASLKGDEDKYATNIPRKGDSVALNVFY
jgi:class 3 adenylate cyclase